MIKVRRDITKKQIQAIQIELFVRRKHKIDNTIVKGRFNNKDMIYIKGKWEEATKKLICS